MSRDFERHPTTGAPYVINPQGKKALYHRPSHFWPFDDYAGVPPIYALRGTHVHALTDYACNYEEVPDWFLQKGEEELQLPRLMQFGIMGQWLEFREAHGIETIRVELQMVNDDWRIAGTLDRYDYCHADIETDFGLVPAGSTIIGDTKTGSDPRKAAYAIQLPGYRDGVPYDTETDTRQAWSEGDPHMEIAFIYHYPLNEAVKGNEAAWKLVPVRLRDGRVMGDQIAALRGFAKSCYPAFAFG